MKRFLALCVVATMILACMPFCAYAVSFSDMSSDHWAMANVARLVTEGTINGFPDGRFNPTGTVTRAEFVKMLGKSAHRFEKDFADVNASHWAYDYIMYSQLDGDASGNFRPSEPITRADAAGLLYKRFGGGAKEKAPYAIWGDASSPDAAAWVYNTGLMVGSDYVNLRLGDTLTRAEAATLIVRAKDLVPGKTKIITENFTDEAYKNIYEGSRLFDSAYEPNGNITYEELSAAAMRFQYKYRNPVVSYEFEKLYDGEYAKFWSVASKYALDEKGIKATLENGRKLATVEDALAILTVGAMGCDYPEDIAIAKDGKTYSDVSIKDPSSRFADVMSFAYNFGIVLNKDGSLGAKKLITKKDAAKIVMQYMLTYGTQTAYHCGYNASYLTPHIRLDASSYPANRAYFAEISQNIPNKVYDTQFVTQKTIKQNPKEFMSVASALGNIYATAFMEVAAAAYEKGAEIYVDYYPSLSVKLGDESGIFRVKITIEKPFDGMKLSDIMTLSTAVANRPIVKGESFWCDVITNAPISGTLYLDYSKMVMDQIIE